MKRIICFMIVLFMLFGIGHGFAPQDMNHPFQITTYAASETKPKKVKNLHITTANKSKYLKLTWDAQPNVNGYQVYRSTSGKTGTYERVAVVKKAAYADSGLKNATAYYYKVRAYMNRDGKKVYGSFAKIDLSTRITTAYAEKLSRRVYRVAEDWLIQYWFDDYAPERVNETPIVMKYTGDPALRWIYGNQTSFYKLNHPTIKTMKQLKAYLMKTFSKATVNEITKHYYKEIDGELYRIQSVSGDELAILYPSKNTVKFSKITDRRVDFVLYVTSAEYDYDLETMVTKVIPCKESLYYQNGRWVFGKNVDGYTWSYGMWFLDGDRLD